MSAAEGPLVSRAEWLAPPAAEHSPMVVVVDLMPLRFRGACACGWQSSLRTASEVAAKTAAVRHAADEASR